MYNYNKNLNTKINIDVRYSAPLAILQVYPTKITILLNIIRRRTQRRNYGARDIEDRFLPQKSYL